MSKVPAKVPTKYVFLHPKFFEVGCDSSKKILPAKIGNYTGTFFQIVAQTDWPVDKDFLTAKFQ